MVQLNEAVQMESVHNIKALRTNQAGEKKKIWGKDSPNAKQPLQDTDNDSSGELGYENESGNEENYCKTPVIQTPTKLTKNGTPARPPGRPPLKVNLKCMSLH